MPFFATSEDNRLLSLGDLFYQAGVSSNNQVRHWNVGQKIWESDLTADQKIEKMKAAVIEFERVAKLKSDNFDEMIIQKMKAAKQEELVTTIFDESGKKIGLTRKQVIDGCLKNI